jgi:hypothetical protein
MAAAIVGTRKEFTVQTSLLLTPPLLMRESIYRCRQKLLLRVMTAALEEITAQMISKLVCGHVLEIDDIT